MKKKLFLALLALILAVGGYMAVLSRQNPTAELPELKEADILLQTAWTDQSPAIIFATHSIYTHVGILQKGPNGWEVLEANKVVDVVPLEQWINSGEFRRVTVRRDPRITDADREQILSRAHQFLGRPYDRFFLTGENELYCSEIPYLSWLYVGKRIGEAKPVSTLHLDNPFVKKLIEQRWQSHPTCVHYELGFEECYKWILRQNIVTPVSIARDPNLKTIYDNYPF